MRRSIILVLGILLVCVRPAGGKADGPPIVFSLAEAHVELGQELDIPLLANTSTMPGGFYYTTLEVRNEERDQLELVGWSLGQGMQAHILVHGEPLDCDFHLESGL